VSVTILDPEQDHMIRMHTASREGITHIVRNLRDRDRREIFALRWDDDEDALIDNITANAGPLWRVWSWDNAPIAVSGVVPVRPGVVICGAFGTEQYRKAVRPIAHWARTFIIPALQRSNYHRAEAYALASNTDGRAFIELIGGEVEALLQGYGRNREDFLLYTWDLTQPTGRRARHCA